MRRICRDLKILAGAVAVFSGIVFAMPTSSQGMPQAAPVKINSSSNDNLAQVDYRRHCRHGRCHPGHRRYARFRESHPPYCPPYYGYYTPYYGADLPCKGRYRPGRYLYYPYYRYHFVF